MTDVQHGTVAAHARAPVHPRWVRVSHGIVAASLLTLAVSGYFILMVHPRLYWGDVGNDLTPALLELPISRNHRHGGWSARTALTSDPSGPASASRTYDIFNQNGWARSLHFLAAWCLVLPGAAYVIAGVAGGHFKRRVWPNARDLEPANVTRDVADHLRFRATGSEPGRYGVLQKLAYSLVVFVGAPMMGLTGLAMSPAITAAFPWLVRAFGGYQSARTLHFLTFVALVLFVLVHVAMVALSGFKRQVRAITVGG
jgi:thiosulfate reductase cytochrome b subunit